MIEIIRLAIIPEHIDEPMMQNIFKREIFRIAKKTPIQSIILRPTQPSDQNRYGFPRMGTDIIEMKLIKNPNILTPNIMKIGNPKLNFLNQ